jgi:hypothetical protein
MRAAWNDGEWSRGTARAGFGFGFPHTAQSTSYILDRGEEVAYEHSQA